MMDHKRVLERTVPLYGKARSGCRILSLRVVVFHHQHSGTRAVLGTIEDEMQIILVYSLYQKTDSSAGYYVLSRQQLNVQTLVSSRSHRARLFLDIQKRCHTASLSCPHSGSELREKDFSAPCVYYENTEISYSRLESWDNSS